MGVLLVPFWKIGTFSRAKLSYGDLRSIPWNEESYSHGDIVTLGSFVGLRRAGYTWLRGHDRNLGP